MTAPGGPIKLVGKRPGPNKKLFAVLGVVVVLASGFELLPGLLGGGGSVPPFHPASNFHIVRATPPTPGSGTSNATGNPFRDPFGAPPGYGSAR